MPSTLTFPSTAGFRDKLLARNLSPYTVPGSYVSQSQSSIVHEVILRDEGIFNSDDNLIADDPFADLLYPLNAYGPNGGYNKNINVGGLSNTVSNLGPYDFMDAKLPQLSAPFELTIPTQNKYSSQNPIQLVSINNIQSVPTFIQYSDPLSFIPSTYSPYQILMDSNPQGSDGTLSQDSYITQLGASSLKKLLKDRASTVTVNTLQNQNANINQGIFAQATDLLRGNTNLLNTTAKITITNGPDDINGNFIQRISGSYSPTSPIPGDYFQDELNSRYPAVVGQIGNALNVSSILGPIQQYLGPKVIRTKSPSERLLLNTGSGTSSALFRSLNYNKYKPNYRRNLLQDVAQGVINVLGVAPNIDVPTNYYVGSSVQDPTYISSPLGEVPYDSLGRDTQAIVYGPTDMSKLFENNAANNLKIGFNSGSFTDGFGVGDGLVWTSPKYNNAGYRALIGGDQGSEGPSFNEVKSKIDSILSNDYTFTEDSILSNTQRLVDSTPRGSKRLSHVGNAINQLSKVFNDGYKEITKGSKVVSYVDTNGVVVGNEYCRIFTKDTPYLTFDDLQKTDGNHRKFTYSVLDNTYNLNIAPFKNPGSSNIVDGKVKKYMFSIENLAWRTSNRPGFTYDELPECEKGPNGGRIMWFPPYNITFNESVSPHFSENNFLGRPEPIYTYQNTKRSGSLSWSIIVDHPSVLNLIVNKQLKNIAPQEMNRIIDSFFAGCLKYDIYELARRWNTFSKSDLFELQQIISQPRVTQEDFKQVVKENPPVVEETKPATTTPQPDLTPYIGIGYYFDNDIPDPNTTNTVSTTAYDATYNTYTSPSTLQRYQNNAATNQNKESISSFFKEVIEGNFDKNKLMVTEIQKIFESNKTTDGKGTTATIRLVLAGSASAPNTRAYNKILSQRRVDSVIKYLRKVNGGVLANYLDSQKLIVTQDFLGEEAIVIPKDGTGKPVGPSAGFTCTDSDTNKTPYDKIYSPNAMACRRDVIKDLTVDPIPATQVTPADNTTSNQPNDDGGAPFVGATPVPPTITTTQKIKDGISKKILRNLLSECDYFEMIEQSNPMFYDSIKQQIKYFSPTFHSITPEGLNSRLTFLQQCMRPGDTIPVIGTDGKPKYNSSVNTSFGAPPVLVLRVGDFYHTKIIPTGLQISYDPLVFDMNPEGIGVQPMIAKISLNFNFVGGQGLKEPIDKLQNALSFNYYGNTEMYDDRADATDDSYKKIDEALVKAILDDSPIVGINNLQNNIPNEGGDTIGTILDKVESDAGTSGSTSYEKIMDSIIPQGQSYMDSAVNKTEQIIKDFNLPVLQLFSSEVNYSKGKTREFTTPKDLEIYGKPENVEKRINELFDKVVNDINSVNSENDSGFDVIRELYYQKFSNTVMRKVKSQMVNQVNLARQTMITSLTSVNQEITTNQQNLVKTFGKLDVIDTKTDGYIKSDQNVMAYNLSATTEVQAGSQQTNTYDELVFDYNSAVDLLYSFYTDFKSAGFVGTKVDLDDIKLLKPNGFGTNSEVWADAEKRFYAAMSKVVLDNNTYQSFSGAVITPDIVDVQSGGPTLGSKFNQLFSNRINNFYKTEHEAEIKSIGDFKATVYESPQTKKYKPWTPFKDKKVRKFTFTNYVATTQTQSTQIQNLYKNGNSNTDVKTFNGKNKFN